MAENSQRTAVLGGESNTLQNSAEAVADRISARLAFGDPSCRQAELPGAFQPSAADVGNLLATENIGLGLKKEDLKDIGDTANDPRTRQLARFLDANFDDVKKLSAGTGLFTNLDHILSDRLTGSDLKTYGALLSEQKKVVAPAKDTSRFLQDNFSVIDTDGDGRLSRPEIENMKASSKLPSFGLEERKQFILDHFDGMAALSNVGSKTISREAVNDQRIDGFLNSAYGKIQYEREMAEHVALPQAGLGAGAALGVKAMVDFFKGYSQYKTAVLPLYAGMSKRAFAISSLVGAAAASATLPAAGWYTGKSANEVLYGGSVHRHVTEQALPAMQRIMPEYK